MELAPKAAWKTETVGNDETNAMVGAENEDAACLPGKVACTLCLDGVGKKHCNTKAKVGSSNVFAGAGEIVNFKICGQMQLQCMRQ